MTDKTTKTPALAKISAVKGMNDTLPPESARWEWLEEKVRSQMTRHAFRNIRTPILEHTQLFVRGIGEVTDIVEKEMYAFADRADKNGAQDHLALRPEGTASIVRASIEHSMLYEGGKRFYYMGPMFRRERPQRGRLRQFHQVGAETLGYPGPEADVELIALAVALFKDIGIDDWRLEINSLGQPAERALHRTELVAYLQQHEDLLDEEARRRMHSNPLRVLDSKNPAIQAILNNAPRLVDFLGAESRKHFETLQVLLDACGIAWTVNPRLVRGLDYYNLTVFEFVTDRLGAQGTLLAGGRYDFLMAQMGGQNAPAVGWALGMERVLELLAENAALAGMVQPLDTYAIIADASVLPAVLQTLQTLRSLGVSVQMHAAAQGSNGMGSMKSQFKRADASGARYALIFGVEELARGCVSVKPLRADSPSTQSSQQTDYPLADVCDWGLLLAR